MKAGTPAGCCCRRVQKRSRVFTAWALRFTYCGIVDRDRYKRGILREFVVRLFAILDALPTSSSVVVTLPGPTIFA
jgi:hypothetical protein